jgi:hypothetical protein
LKPHIGNARHAAHRDVAKTALRLRYESSHEDMLERLAELIEAPNNSHQLIIEYLALWAEAGVAAVVIENAVEWITRHPHAAMSFLFQFEHSAIGCGHEREMYFLLDMD